MFIGEAPGADEDASGVPFVGRAGQKLNEMINAMKLDREAEGARRLHRQCAQSPPSEQPDAHSR